MWLICEHMVKRIWKKGGKWFLFLPLAFGLLHILWLAYAGVGGNGYIQTTKGFLPYEYMVDDSFAPWLFMIGFGGLLFVIFWHYKQYHTKSNGIITFLTLPISTKQLVTGILLSGVIWVFLYYALWVLALVVWYFPATEVAAHVAMKQQFLAEGNQIITGIDPHIHNGLYLAFRRSIFLSNMLFFVKDGVIVWQEFLLQMILLFMIAITVVVAGIVPQKSWLFLLLCTLCILEKVAYINNSIWMLSLLWTMVMIKQIIQEIYAYMKYPTV